jgi:hypothetical protein
MNLLKTEDDRRKAFNASKASNELEGFYLSADDEVRFESMVKGETTMANLLAAFKQEDGLK